MKRILSIIMMMFLTTVFTFWVQTTEARSEDLPEERLPEIFEEELWIIFIDEPSGAFMDAREYFMKGDLEEAAHNIRVGAAFLQLETSRAAKAEKKALNDSAIELKTLANSVEKGSVTMGGILEEAFARAEYAMAQHHYQKAVAYETAEDYEKMTRAMEAASGHLLSAIFWADEEMDQGDITAIKESQSTARKSTKGASMAKKKLGEAAKSLGRGLKNFGKKFKPSKGEK